MNKTHKYVDDHIKTSTGRGDVIRGVVGMAALIAFIVFSISLCRLTG